MTYKLFSVRDDVADCFHSPIQCATEAEAIRLFRHQIETDDFLRLHSVDYALYLIGEYDSEAGVITGRLPEKIYHCAKEVPQQ